MDETIQFFAKHGSWVAVKKMSIDENTEPMEIVFFLSSVASSVSNAMDKYIRQAVDVSPLEKVLDEEIKSKRASMKAVEEAVAAVQGRKVQDAIKSIVESSGLTKKEAAALKDILRVYALRLAFSKVNVPFDYGKAYENIKPSIRGRKPKA